MSSTTTPQLPSPKMVPEPTTTTRRRTSGVLTMQRRTSGTSSVASLASTASTAGGRTFPEKLMDMMQTTTSDPTASTYSRSLHWLPHGKSFVITDPDAFSTEVLTRYFKSTKFKSFTRKLYRWGFRQITKGPDKGSYYHELFVRDDPALCVRMNCHYSDKERRTQADNAAKRRASYGNGSVVAGGETTTATSKQPGQGASAGRRGSGARDALAHATERMTLGGAGGGGGGGGGTRRGSFTVPGEDDDDEMAIMRAAAAFGGGGSRTSLGGGGRASLSGRLSGAGGRLSLTGGGGHGRRGSGTQFQQAQRRVSATRRQSYGSAVSGLSGFDDDDDDEGMGETLGAAAAGRGSAVPTSIHIGGGGAAAATQQQNVGATVAAQSSSAVTAAVAAAQAQAAAQYSAMMMAESSSVATATAAAAAAAAAPKTAEEILAQHRLEDAILAQQEAAIRARREQLQREQEDRLRSLELLAAAKSGASASAGSVPSGSSASGGGVGGSLAIPGVPSDPAQIKAVQQQMCQARAVQLRQEQEGRLKALELMAAAKAQGGAGGLDPATAAKMKQLQDEMSRARAAQLRKEQEDRLKALELMAAAKAVGQQRVGAVPTGTTRLPDSQPPTALDILAEASATATAKAPGDVTNSGIARNGKTTSNGATTPATEQQLLLDAMKRYQQQG